MSAMVGTQTKRFTPRKLMSKVLCPFLYFAFHLPLR